MNRRSFAHTEKPYGATPPTHRVKALDTISSLSSRGSANIKAEQLRKPVTGAVGGQPKRPSPVALEAINRLRQQPNRQMNAIPQQQPYQPYPAAPSYPQPENPAIQPLPPEMQPLVQPIMQQQQQVSPQDDFQMPPVDGYYNQKLQEIVATDPGLQKEWQPVLERFAQIRASLDTIRQRVFEYRRGMANA